MRYSRKSGTLSMVRLCVILFQRSNAINTIKEILLTTIRTSRDNDLLIYQLGLY